MLQQVICWLHRLPRLLLFFMPKLVTSHPEPVEHNLVHYLFLAVKANSIALREMNNCR